MTYIVNPLPNINSDPPNHNLWLVTLRCDLVEFSDDLFTKSVIDCWFESIRSADEHYIYSGWIMREQTFTALCLQWPALTVVRREK